MKQQFRHQWVRDLTEMILIQFCSIHHILIWEKNKKESGLITEWRLVLTHSSHSMTIPLQAKLKMEYYRPQKQLGELHNGSPAEFNLWEKILLCMQGLCFACCCVRYLEFLVFLWPSLRSRNQNIINKEGSYLLREMLLVMSKARNTVVWLTPAGFSFRGQRYDEEN